MRIAAGVIVFLLLSVLLAPILTEHNPMQTFPERALSPPDQTHPLGTDYLGRDVFSRVLYGGQRTLAVSALASLIAVVPGVSLGIVAGTLGGWADRILVVLVNSMLAIPALVTALVIITLLGQGGWQLALAIGGAQIALVAQVARGTATAIRQQPYIEGAQALGASWGRIMRRYILPNSASTLLAYTGVVMSYSIINGAALSFLGLGGDPGIPDWGIILAEGRYDFRAAPWVVIAPGLLITVTVLAVNTLADGLAAGRFRRDRVG